MSVIILNEAMLSKELSRKVAIIIPVYNEDQVIEDVVKKVKKHFSYVICVDDGSKDDSSSKICAADGILIRHPINMGQGAALQTGIEFAKELPVSYFVTFDADGQHRIEDVATMLKEIEKGKQDILLGSRFLGQAISMRNSKKILLKVAVFFTRITTGLKLTDTHNGLRVFNRKVAEEIQITMPDMAHASEILEIVAEKKYRYKEVPITIEYTDYSVAKGQGAINAINIGLDVLLRKVTKK